MTAEARMLRAFIVANVSCCRHCTSVGQRALCLQCSASRTEMVRIAMAYARRRCTSRTGRGGIRGVVYEVMHTYSTRFGDSKEHDMELMLLR